MKKPTPTPLIYAMVFQVLFSNSLALALDSQPVSENQAEETLTNSTLEYTNIIYTVSKKKLIRQVTDSTHQVFHFELCNIEYDESSNAVRPLQCSPLTGKWMTTSNEDVDSFNRTFSNRVYDGLYYNEKTHEFNSILLGAGSLSSLILFSLHTTTVGQYINRDPQIARSAIDRAIFFGALGIFFLYRSIKESLLGQPSLEANLYRAIPNLEEELGEKNIKLEFLVENLFNIFTEALISTEDSLGYRLELEI